MAAQSTNTAPSAGKTTIFIVRGSNRRSAEWIEDSAYRERGEALEFAESELRESLEGWGWGR